MYKYLLITLDKRQVQVNLIQLVQDGSGDIKRVTFNVRQMMVSEIYVINPGRDTSLIDVTTDNNSENRIILQQQNYKRLQLQLLK